MKNVLEVRNVSKKYRLGEFTGKRYWQELRQSFGHKEPMDDNVLWALKDINFEIKQGDVLALIGANGAGKSTLLKVLSRITAPTSGRILYQGSLGSLLELGAGFHPELTGRENIYLSGSILGMKRYEIKNSLDAIVDFSDMGAYLDTPIRRYSSGMIIKLAFSISAYLRATLLLYDEVLAVADHEFRQKALNKIIDMVKNEGKTAIFVSHNQSQLKALCNKGLILRNGQQDFFGSYHQAIEKYLSNSQQLSSNKIEWQQDLPKLGSMKLHSAEVRGNEQGSVNYTDELNFVFVLSFDEYTKSPFFDIKIENQQGHICFHSSFNQTNGFVAKDVGTYRLKLTLPAKFINPGRYALRMSLMDMARSQSLNLAVPETLTFSIASSELVHNMNVNYWTSSISPENGVFEIESIDS